MEKHWNMVQKSGVASNGLHTSHPHVPSRLGAQLLAASKGQIGVSIKSLVGFGFLCIFRLKFINEYSTVLKPFLLMLKHSTLSTELIRSFEII